MFAFEAAQDCVVNKGASWVNLSAGLRQVREWMLKAERWADLWCREATDAGMPVGYKAKAEAIEFTNGSRIIGLPANPKTARGYSAHLILDEFAYHDNPDQIWAGIFPSVSNEIAFQYKVRIGSTVAGKNNKFWKLLDERDSEYSKHIVTVERAVRDGMPINIERLRKAVNDDDIWRQEYMCEPVDAASTLLPYDLLKACTSQDASLGGIDDCELDYGHRQFVVGMDIGRQHDLSVIWLAEIVGTKLITRRVEELRRVPLAQQRERLFWYMRHESVLCACIDKTGIGFQIAEEAEAAFGSRAIGIMFTQQSKQELFLGLQGAMQRREFLIPDDNATHEDFHSVQRLFTTGGRVLFSAPTRPDGHSDRATAAALCVYARKRCDGISSGAEPINLFEDARASVPSLGRMVYV